MGHEKMNFVTQSKKTFQVRIGFDQNVQNVKDDQNESI